VLGVPQVAAAVDRATREIGVVVGLRRSGTRVESQPRALGQLHAVVAPQVDLLERVVGDAVLFSTVGGAEEAVVMRASGGPRRCSLAHRGIASGDIQCRRGARARPAPGDHVDHAAQRCRAEERRQRAAHDLDALDHRRGNAVEVDRPPAQQIGRVVERHAIEQHDGEVRVAAAHLGYRQAATRSAADQVQAGHEPDQLGHRVHADRLDRLAVEHGHRGRGIDQRPGHDGRRLVQDGLGRYRGLAGRSGHHPGKGEGSDPAEHRNILLEFRNWSLAASDPAA
jgi:hypothetical protein